jgi:hypothetical protein
MTVSELGVSILRYVGSAFFTVSCRKYRGG